MSTQPSKDHLLFNKIAAAILIALLILLVLVYFSSYVYSPDKSKKTTYKIGDDDAVVASVATEEDVIEDVNNLLAVASIDKGAKLIKKCTSCHTIDANGANKTGPNIYNVVNSNKAVRDFKYSDALKNVGGVWDYASLNHFLYKPKKYAPGTKMNFAGLKKVSDRADLIAYLRSLSPNPAPLP